MADILKGKERVWDGKAHNFGLIPESNIEMLKKEEKEVKTTSLQRLALQEPQCGFGELGVCCRMCYMGPCRIDVFNGGPRVGVCGATADVIVARNLLRETVGGAAAHAEHAMDIAEVLKEVAEGKISTYSIKDENKLKAVAQALGVKTDGKDIKEIAKEVAEISLEDFKRLEKEPAVWVKAYAPKSSYETWEKLGVVPHNAWKPIMNAMHRTSMGNDADPINILLADLQMGLIDGYMGLTMATELSDVLFGTPKPIRSYANLATIKPEYVNIAVHGHNPLLSEKIVEWADKLNDKAKSLGAKGINIVGICCTGNEVLMRHGIPLAGNEFQAELAIVTGALDAMVVDYQCIWPILADVASCYHTKLITTIPFVKIPGAMHFEYSPEKADEVAKQVIETALEAYTHRDPSRVYIPDTVEEIIAGFSVEALIDVLKKVNPDDPLKPLIDNIVNGNIFGVVAIVGCPNPKTRRLAFTERMIKGLIKNNVLVIVTGCIAHIAGQTGFLNPNKVDSFEVGEGLKQVLKALGGVAGLNSLPVAIHMGSCVDNSRIGVLLKALSERLGLKVSDLPVVASAPELISEKAISIGTWALALGVTVHVCPPPRILGGPKVREVLTKELKSITGGEAYVECDPELAVKGILDRIRQKRIALNLPVPETIAV
jgi:carbon-monoxide dehydrogenase catalytic subunit